MGVVADIFLLVAGVLVGAYVLAFLVIFGLVLRLTRRSRMRACLVVIVVGIFSIYPIQFFKKVRADDAAAAAYRAENVAKLNRAKAAFAERCKLSGETVHRKIDDVDGIFLVKLQHEELRGSYQYTLNDPYGGELQGDSYIKSFLVGRQSDGSVNWIHTQGGFQYVEVESEDRTIQRIRLVPLPGETPPTRFALEKTPVAARAARYGVERKDISTKEDRDDWIAGSVLRVVDLSNGEVIAERVGYLLDLSLGRSRSPWSVTHACPTFSVDPSGGQDRSSRSREFVLRVLQSKQGS